jgi:hypothetical protein
MRFVLELANASRRQMSAGTHFNLSRDTSVPFMERSAFKEMCGLLFVLDNGCAHEKTVFNHHLPHATCLFVHKDLVMASAPAASLKPWATR